MHYNTETIDDYLSGELGSERDATIHAHLEGCVECRTRYDEAASARDWLRAAAAAEEREFPSMIRARVWEAVRAAEDAPPSFADRLRALWRPMVAVPVAAALAVFVYAGVPGIGLHAASAPAGVAAQYLMEEHAALASDNPLADRGLVVPASLAEDQQSSGLIESNDDTAASSER